MRILIKGGIAVNENKQEQADILVEGGKIAAVGGHITAPDAQVLDAAGCYVFPGFIDTHTHFDLDTGSAVTADDFLTGTRAAILGGVTTVLDFATQERGGTLRGALDAWQEKARASSCNYGFHMALSEWNERICGEMADMPGAGVTSYKMYMVYAMRVDDGEIYCAMRRAQELGAIVSVHCENYHLVERGIIEQKALGGNMSMAHALSRPAAVEAEAVNRYLRIAQLAKAPAYVVHLSTGEGLDAARQARARGQEVYLETCPQYLVLDDARYLDPDGAKYVMSPPLRKPEDCKSLLQALHGNEIDAVGTDHCSFTMAQKARGASDFTAIPNGAAGVQTRAALYYTYGVEKGLITLTQMAAQLCTNAAKLFGMYPRKGCIAPQSDADIVIWEPGHEDVISYKTLAHNCDNTPYEGMRTQGRARDVLLGGAWVVQGGVLVQPGLGKYVHREKPCRYREK